MFWITFGPVAAYFNYPINFRWKKCSKDFLNAAYKAESAQTSNKNFKLLIISNFWTSRWPLWKLPQIWRKSVCNILAVWTTIFWIWYSIVLWTYSMKSHWCISDYKKHVLLYAKNHFPVGRNARIVFTAILIIDMYFFIFIIHITFIREHKHVRTWHKTDALSSKRNH